jgi:probable rRNA maturation factor
MKESNFEISKAIKGSLPRLPFKDMKKEVLGERYNLSLVIADNKLSKKLNKIYRGKDYPTNVLSFPISKSEGEIYLNLNIAKKEAPEFGLSYTKFVGLLFIHGLFHLKGMEHGSRMETEEHKVRRKFSLL